MREAQVLFPLRWKLYFMKDVEVLIHQVHGSADLFHMGQGVDFGQHFLPTVSGFCLTERYVVFLLHESCGFGLAGCNDHPSDDINLQIGKIRTEFLIIRFSEFGEVLIEQKASYGLAKAG
jgi:hypothetical protein